MARRTRPSPARHAAALQKERTHQQPDSFQNFAARVGLGTDNLSTGSGYGFNPITRNRVQVEWAYRGSWIVGQAVDCVADDMTREGVDIHSELKPEEIDQIHKEADRLQVWDKLAETIKWARLYGGAIGLIMIDGQKPNTPLRPETVQKGQFRGILPIDRWALQPSLNDLVDEYGPNFGKPKYYDTVVDANAGLPRMRIHYTRVIRLEGVELPYWQRITENLWGQSVLERLWDRLVAFDSVTQGAAQLVYKAYLRTLKVKGLRDIIAAGGPAMAGLTAQVDLIRKFQSNEGLTLLDGEDEFEAQEYSFSGLSDVQSGFAEQLSGALQIPLVRLFGQSPAGFNTGEADVRSYYDNIKQQQEARLRPDVEKLYLVLCWSTHGRAPPKNYDIEFRNLWQLTDEQRATVTATATHAVVEAYEAQLIDRATGMKELKAQSKVTGAFSSITDEQIEEAESDPPPTPEALGLAIPAPAVGGPGQEKAGPKAAKDSARGTSIRAVA